MGIARNFWLARALWQALGVNKRLTPKRKQAATRKKKAPKRVAHARRMGHEAIRLILPGFDEAVRKGLEQTRPDKPGPVPLIHETGLHDVTDLDAYIIGYFKELVHAHGWSLDNAEDETDIVALHAYLALNFALQGRKAFWVDEKLAGMLAQTTLDISGDVLRLPFPACGFIFDDQVSLELATAMVAADPDAQLRGSRIKVLTVYALDLPPESGPRGIRLAFTSDDLSGRWPHVVTRDIPTVDRRNLDEVLDSHPEGPSGPLFSTPQVREVVRLAINAILYTTCSDFRFEERKSPVARPGWRPLSRKHRRAQERASLSGETVFYLPGRITIGGSGSSSSGHQAESSWKLSKRFWVRGHWRRPSPSWTDQRLRWIEPYLKGPEMTAVIEREYELKA